MAVRCKENMKLLKEVAAALANIGDQLDKNHKDSKRQLRNDNVDFQLFVTCVMFSTFLALFSLC